jgi:hypothetical protein
MGCAAAALLTMDTSSEQLPKATPARDNQQYKARLKILCGENVGRDIETPPEMS